MVVHNQLRKQFIKEDSRNLPEVRQKDANNISEITIDFQRTLHSTFPNLAGSF
jgi:hypothetical protein